MLRVVLDTSCIASYLLTAGAIMQGVVALWQTGEIILLSSPSTRSELAQVLNRPAIRERSKVDLGVFVAGYERHTEHTPNLDESPGVCRDPKDEKFIACAISGSADYLVSSDRDLLALRRHEGIAILSPGQLLIAVQLHQLDSTAIGERFSLPVLKEILATVPLQSATEEKLNSLIPSME